MIKIQTQMMDALIQVVQSIMAILAQMNLLFVLLFVETD